MSKNSKLFVWSLIAALAGFLFGFDTVVISGADETLQALWGSSELFHGLVVMSTALWGTVIGALFGGKPINALGRKKTLFWIGVLYFISALGSALVSDPYWFAFFRFIGGLGVGASTVAAPAYIAEIAPAAKRGQLVAMYQFNIVFGIMIAFISNFLFEDIGENAWRWMIGIEALPALIYTLVTLIIPRSPRWLVLYKNDEAEAREVLGHIYSVEEVDEAISSIRSSEQKKSSHESIFSKKYRFTLGLAFLIAFFNQLSGINAFLYYAPRIFELAGLEKSAALLGSIGIGVVNLIFTLLGLFLIDRMGRRFLLYIGSLGYIVSLSMVSAAFFFGWDGLMVPGFLFLFIASHAVGQGAVIWVFIAEIFPTHLRGAGQAFGTSTHWVLAALITVFMPSALESMGNPGVVFAIFAFMMVLQLIWVHFVMPETKGVSLEKLGEKLKYTS